MNFLFSGLFWGVFLIVMGISIIVKMVFNINIPVVRIFFALFFVYLGISIITGGFGHKNTAVFNDVKITNSSNSDEYNVIFGKGDIDLSNIVLADKDIHIKINTVFGSSEVFINPETPAIIKVDSAFSGVKLPDDNIISFGTNTYRTKTYNDTNPKVVIEMSAVFCGVNITEK